MCFTVMRVPMRLYFLVTYISWVHVNLTFRYEQHKEKLYKLTLKKRKPVT